MHPYPRVRHPALVSFAFAALSVASSACDEAESQGPRDDVAAPDSAGDVAGPDTVGDDVGEPDVSADAVTGEETRVDVEGPAEVSDTETSEVGGDAVIDAEPVEVCDFNGLAPFTSQSYSLSFDASQVVHEYAGETASEFLDIRLYEPVTAGRVALGASFEDCTRCVLLGARCDADSCEDWYFATSGDLAVTRLDGPGGRIEGRLTGVTLVEHVLDPDQGTLTPKPGGRRWCLANKPFAADIPAIERGYRLVPQTSVTPRVGALASGDAIYESECPFGKVAVGVEATWDEDGYNVVDSLQLRCVDPMRTPFGEGAIDVGDRIGYPSDFGFESSLLCPAGQLMVGMEVAFTTEAGVEVVSGVAARCADVAAWASSAGPSPAVSVRGWAGDTGTNRFECPRGTALVTLRAEAEIENLGFGFYVRFHSLRGVCQVIEAR